MQVLFLFFGFFLATQVLLHLHLRLLSVVFYTCANLRHARVLRPQWFLPYYLGIPPTCTLTYFSPTWIYILGIVFFCGEFKFHRLRFRPIVRPSQGVVWFISRMPDRVPVSTVSCFTKHLAYLACYIVVSKPGYLNFDQFQCIWNVMIWISRVKMYSTLVRKNTMLNEKKKVNFNKAWDRGGIHL